MSSDRTSSSGHKLKHTRCGRSEYQKEVFSVTLQWLPRDIVDYSSVEIFKSSAATAVENWLPVALTGKGVGLDDL